MITVRAESFADTGITYEWRGSHLGFDGCLVRVKQHGREIDCFELFADDDESPSQLDVTQAIERYEENMLICERCANPCATRSHATAGDWNSPLWCSDCLP